MHDPKMVEMVARAIYLGRYGAEGGKWEAVEPRHMREVWGFYATAALDALAAAGRLVPEGWVAVPREPTEGLLMSMALRADHALGCSGYYNQFVFGVSGGGHARRLEVAISEARKQHEEVVGTGFYKPERDAEYRAMLAAAPQPGTVGEDGG